MFFGMHPKNQKIRPIYEISDDVKKNTFGFMQKCNITESDV